MFAEAGRLRFCAHIGTDAGMDESSAPAWLPSSKGRQRRAKAQDCEIARSGTQGDVAEMDGIRQLFAVMDEVRRVQGRALEACGLGSAECAYRVLASGPC